MKYPRIQYIAAYLAAIFISFCTLKIFYVIIINSMLTLGILDFYIFIEHANLFINQGIIYLRDLSLYGPGDPIYKFPPLYGALLTQALSSGIQENMAYFYAWILQIICYITGILFCLHTRTENTESKNSAIMTSCVFAFALCNNFFIENSCRLQLEPYIFLLLSISIFLLARRKPFGAGLAIGIAAMLKIYPAFLMLYPLFSRHQLRSTINGFIVGCGCALLISIWLLGIDENIFYFHYVLPLLLTENISDSPENLSIGHMLIPVFYFADTAKLINRFIFIAATILWCLVIIRRKPAENTPHRNDTTAIDYASLFMIMMVGMPNFWWNYQLLDLLPAIIAIKIIATDPRKYALPLITLMIVFILQNIITTAPLFFYDLNTVLGDFDKDLRVGMRGSIQILLFISILTLQWQAHSKSNKEFSAAP